MTGVPEVTEGESVVEDGDRIWFRQVHPTFLGKQTGLVLAGAFRLTDADQEDNGTRSSGALDSLCSAQEAFEGRQAIKEGSTCGTWGVSVAEAQEYGFWVIDDHEQFVLIKGHASLDHCDVMMLSKEYKDAKDNLAAAANRRGCLFAPPPLAAEDSS